MTVSKVGRHFSCHLTAKPAGEPEAIVVSPAFNVSVNNEMEIISDHQAQFANYTDVKGWVRDVIMRFGHQALFDHGVIAHFHWKIGNETPWDRGYMHCLMQMLADEFNRTVPGYIGTATFYPATGELYLKPAKPGEEVRDRRTRNDFDADRVVIKQRGDYKVR